MPKKTFTTIPVELTPQQIGYLLNLLHAEQEFDEDSRHVPEDESGERYGVIEELEAYSSYSEE